jgi:hypothetical protein
MEDDKVRITSVIETVKDAEYYRRARKAEAEN